MPHNRFSCPRQSAPPSKALVKGLAKELDIDESFLNRLAEEVRKDLGWLPCIYRHLLTKTDEE
jgi:hypothetical protein